MSRVVEHVTSRRSWRTLVVATCSILVVASILSPTGASSPAQKKATVTVWDAAYLPGSALQASQQRIDQAFMKANPGITINHTGFPFSAYWPTKVQTAIATKRGADVVALGLQGVTTQILQGLVPLKGLLTAPQRKSLVLLSQFDAFDASTRRFPATTYAYYWMYNKALFAKAGISAPPTTFRQLLGACDALKNAGIQPIAAGFQDGSLGQWFTNYGFASQLFSRKDTADWSRGRLGWEDPKMVAAWTNLGTLAKRGCFGPNSAAFTNADAGTQFLGGKAAMIYTCCGIGSDDAVKTLGADVDQFRMPRLPGSAYASTPMDVGPSLVYGITRFSKNCGAAWKYLSYLATPAAQRELAKAGQLPGVKGVTRLTGANRLTRQIQSWLSDPGNHTGPFAASPQEFQELRRLAPQLVNGNVSVDDVTSRLQDLREQNFQPLTAPPGGATACK
jgi:raffinose/stachyose/melibiose transport system substrate-binding protein